MEPSSIVEVFNKRADVAAGVFNGGVDFPLDLLLLERAREALGLGVVMRVASAESFTDIARFGEKKLALLRRFLPFATGTPPHDCLDDIFAALDAATFQNCFANWVAARTKTPVEVIAIDGKTLRGSGGKRTSKAPVHMVSAFAARQRLVLAQPNVCEKSNEIVAIPALRASS